MGVSQPKDYTRIKVIVAYSVTTITIFVDVLYIIYFTRIDISSSYSLGGKDYNIVLIV